MTVLRFSVALVLVSIVQYVSTVTGFATGAGGCAGNEAAVGGFHLDTSNGRSVSTNSLEAAGAAVLIDDVILAPDNVITLTSGRNYTVTVESILYPLRGLLVRVEAPNGLDATGSIIPGMETKVATVCEAPVAGVTHTDNSDKTVLTSTLRFDEAVESVILDVTAVFLNTIEGSVYVYSQYTVNFALSEIPTISPGPVNSPTALPDATTGQPTTPSPTVAPMSSPTAAPMTSPTAAPMTSPTVAPMSSPPTASPTTQPPTPGPILSTMEPTTAAPISTAEPTNAPFDLSDPPSMVPSPAPMEIETLAPVSPTMDPATTTTTMEPTILRTGSDMPSESPTTSKGMKGQMGSMGGNKDGMGNEKGKGGKMSKGDGMSNGGGKGGMGMGDTVNRKKKTKDEEMSGEDKEKKKALRDDKPTSDQGKMKNEKKSRVEDASHQMQKYIKRHRTGNTVPSSEAST